MIEVNARPCEWSREKKIEFKFCFVHLLMSVIFVIKGHYPPTPGASYRGYLIIRVL